MQAPVHAIVAVIATALNKELGKEGEQPNTGTITAIVHRESSRGAAWRHHAEPHVRAEVDFVSDFIQNGLKEQGPSSNQPGRANT